MIRNHFNQHSGLVFSLAGTLVMLIVMAQTGATLKTPATPLGILNLEFAWSAELTYNVISAWIDPISTDNLFAAKINTWLDFIFLLFYATFLYRACKLLAKRYAGFMQRAGRLLAKAALLAGLLDVFENIGMLISLNGYISPTCSFLTVLFSVVKWALAMGAVMYVLIAGSVFLYPKISRFSR